MNEKKNRMGLKIAIVVFSIIIVALSAAIYIKSSPAHEYDNVIKKPVMYFYPEQDNTLISVSIDLDGKFNAVYPEFNNLYLLDIKNGKRTVTPNTWVFRADKDGTLTITDNLFQEQHYNYLFWDGTFNKKLTIDNGYCVAKEDTLSYLEDTLTELGLNDKEKNDFITFWLPELYKHDYNIISFDIHQYEQCVNLDINPAPDSFIRVFMTFKGCDKYVEMEKPIYTGTVFGRRGFTVVEWGGTEVH
jgi:hypothetical protein